MRRSGEKTVHCSLSQHNTTHNNYNIELDNKAPRSDLSTLHRNTWDYDWYHDTHTSIVLWRQVQEM